MLLVYFAPPDISTCIDKLSQECFQQSKVVVSNIAFHLFRFSDQIGLPIHYVFVEAFRLMRAVLIIYFFAALPAIIFGYL